MKIQPERIMPVLIAVGLWAIGNALVPVMPAKGQEIALVFNTCHPDDHANNPGLPLIDCAGGSSEICYENLTISQKCAWDINGSLEFNCIAPPIVDAHGKPAAEVDHYAHHCVEVNGQYTCPPFDAANPTAGGWDLIGTTRDGTGNSCNVFPVV